MPNALIEYRMDDGREVSIEFSDKQGHVTIRESFDGEATHTVEEQREGWQAI